MRAPLTIMQSGDTEGCTFQAPGPSSLLTSSRQRLATGSHHAPPLNINSFAWSSGIRYKRQHPLLVRTSDLVHDQQTSPSTTLNSHEQQRRVRLEWLPSFSGERVWFQARAAWCDRDRDPSLESDRCEIPIRAAQASGLVAVDSSIGSRGIKGQGPQNEGAVECLLQTGPHWTRPGCPPSPLCVPGRLVSRTWPADGAADAAAAEEEEMACEPPGSVSLLCRLASSRGPMDLGSRMQRPAELYPSAHRSRSHEPQVSSLAVVPRT